MSDVLTLASSWRAAQFEEAQAADVTTSKWEAPLRAMESEVLYMIHDILRRDHPKDWRCMSMFVLDAYRTVRVFVLRVTREGRLHVEQLVPASGDTSHTVWLAIY